MTYLDLVSVRNTKTYVRLDILCAFCMKYYTNSPEPHPYLMILEKDKLIRCKWPTVEGVQT